MSSAKYELATQCLIPIPGEAGIVAPIDPSTAYRFIQDGERIYPRCFNTPYQQLVADRIATLENAEGGLVFASGMSAISTAILTLVGANDHVILPSSLYGGTRAFVAREFPRFGIDFDFVENTPERFAERITTRTRLIYAESPTNPRLDVIDLAALAALARQHNLISIVDNTFASPVNQNPIDFGIDLVVHSGTKYLGGHSDLTCGAVVGATEYVNRIRDRVASYGGILNPLDCYLLLRSLKTLAVRVQRQNENAQAIAEFLVAQPQVIEVLYPGLKDHPRHAVAAAQMRGYGGMISFVLEESRSVPAFLEALRVITPAISLGGVESTACLPAFTSHLELSVDEQQRAGVTPQLVRLSTGIEDCGDLIDDLAQALAR